MTLFYSSEQEIPLSFSHCICDTNYELTDTASEAFLAVNSNRPGFCRAWLGLRTTLYNRPVSCPLCQAHYTSLRVEAAWYFYPMVTYSPCCSWVLNLSQQNIKATLRHFQRTVPFNTAGLFTSSILSNQAFRKKTRPTGEQPEMN